ncbi:probable E3 ubiquitin-protein ligase TRIML1 isoform X3 [Canis lupus baileyi]|uniref:probable E3 ubiquitin-protein ligase TRIML1 isoform X2 n=1 Tax=Canis lupus familiaris TaxID=9615 RepID=UPI000BA9FA46|nr:probable E3 ubiquitin-protein ligase TRIML1 isoform X2 [Canis lupus familiaris]XP_025327505.1 probable E3 ubiquitin-protein ligase TRIML1 isoform X3 [Canis lupus dingo]XP_038416246.1 probable E3 ubiquitin-protein ligase TRIML1 isoform X2 [Canis lupus familiaris]|eukprot:XP_022259878.1 probable E3 ubiquitin-protein ligase TRIML1 isoform X2 [Canis lupus familiaris]
MSFFVKMSTSDLMENLREELTCFICLDYFTSPVTTECGHSFCLLCLLRSWEEHNTPLSCPECWRTLESPHFQPNERLGRLAGIGKQLRSQEKLKEILNLLHKKRKETQVILTHEKERVILCKEETKACKQVVVSEYAKMHQFLKEEEQLQLQLLEKEERENMKKLRDNEIKLTQQIRSLSKMIEQIESTCQSSIIESFEDMKGTLERSEPLLLQCPEATTTGLTLCRITGMREMLKKFSTDITLDPATANAYLVLSEDLKSVRHGGIRQHLPDNPERFDQSATVLGAQIFTCGRHYWEVEVGNKTEWEVGICKDSVSRKGNLPKPPGDLFSLIGLKIGDDYSLWVSSPLKGQHVREPVHKVGVFLDYESGHIAFYNVTDESLIYSFPPTSFQEALRPIFSPCLPNEGTNTGPLIICSPNSYI